MNLTPFLIWPPKYFFISTYFPCSKYISPLMNQLMSPKETLQGHLNTSLFVLWLSQPQSRSTSHQHFTGCSLMKTKRERKCCEVHKRMLHSSENSVQGNKLIGLNRFLDMSDTTLQLVPFRYKFLQNLSVLAISDMAKTRGGYIQMEEVED